VGFRTKQGAGGKVNLGYPEIERIEKAFSDVVIHINQRSISGKRLSVFHI
jgi:hypothetical protein